mmetsp:Transcript_3357/g.9606  ORF Transcript_3357/g.9606 Transcript_3357/m.9606 type:complete len:144 (+) Transcript_3357:155-586(+)
MPPRRAPSNMTSSYQCPPQLKSAKVNMILTHRDAKCNTKHTNPKQQKPKNPQPPSQKLSAPSLQTLPQNLARPQQEKQSQVRAHQTNRPQNHIQTTTPGNSASPNLSSPPTQPIMSPKNKPNNQMPRGATVLPRRSPKPLLKP